MLLIAVNYKQEIDYDFFNKFDDVEILVLNEKKGSIFANKILKHIGDNQGKYSMVLHFGICGGKDAGQIGNIYQIDRTYLYHDGIVENQRSNFGKINFHELQRSNIVTKFFIGQHDDNLYDFADIYDLETFFVAQISTISSIPIISIKGVSDINDISMVEYDTDKEIEFLLDPEIKRTKKAQIIIELNDNIEKVNSNLKSFFESEFYGFYQKFESDGKFRKQILC